MRTLLLVLTLAVAVPVRADLILYCQRCDPGNSKTATGEVQCRDCSNQDEPVVPVIVCAVCNEHPAHGGDVCTGCTVHVAGTVTRNGALRYFNCHANTDLYSPTGGDPPSVRATLKSWA